jgi:hypothetical protein
LDERGGAIGVGVESLDFHIVCDVFFLIFLHIFIKLDK